MTVALMMEKNSVVAYRAPSTLVRPACEVLQQEHKRIWQRITLSAISSEAEAINSAQLSSQPGCQGSKCKQAVAEAEATAQHTLQAALGATAACAGLQCRHAQRPGSLHAGTA